MPANPLWRWDDWTGDYRLIRALIAKTFPDQFHDMEARMNQPGGFYRGNAAHERIWKTESGKAEFTTPTTLDATDLERKPGRYRLVTLRSNDQFNTTIYGYSDRLRGIEGERMVLMMAPRDIAEAGLQTGQRVTLVTDLDDGVEPARVGAEGDPLRPAARRGRRLFPGVEHAVAAVAARHGIGDAGREGDPGAHRGVTRLTSPARFPSASRAGRARSGRGRGRAPGRRLCSRATSAR